MSAAGRAETPLGAAGSARIERAPDRAATDDHDLIVVGGGIYGVALCLEATRRGQQTLLIERQDFGGATTWSNLRILHGGLRYLQSLDLRRFHESVGERSWFLRHFPDLVRPLPCLMPLYGRGMRRPSVFRLALIVNDALSWRRNAGIASAVRLPASRLVASAETAKLFPYADRQGLRGGALWHDAVMLSPERLLIEMLRWACAGGAGALNYTEATRLIVDRGAIQGIEARDLISGQPLKLRAPRVVNAAGPWSRRLAERLAQDVPGLFRPALAFNVLLDRPPIAEVAVAVEPKRPRAPTYFCLPWQGMLLAGTSYAPVAAGSLEAAPTDQQVADFLADLNAAVPGLGLEPSDVLQIYAGLLPARADGTIALADREVIHDHGSSGGPKGLYSVSGVKFTTARLVAARTLRRMLGRSLAAQRAAVDRPPPLLDLSGQTLHAAESPLDGGDEQVRARLAALADQESVMCLYDLLLRRMDSTQTAKDRATAAAAARRLLRRQDWPAGPGPAAGSQRVGTGVSPR